MASIQYVVSATDAASAVFAKIGASADGLDKQLADLGKRVASPEVNLKDAKFTLGIIRAAERLDKLNAMRADPEVTLDTAKFQREILLVNAMLDRLGAKSVTVDANVRRGFFGSARGGFLGTLGGLAGLIPGVAGFGGGFPAVGGLLGGGGAGAAGGAAGAGAGALGAAGAGALAALVAGPIGALIDALTGFGAGTLGAGATFGLVSKFRPAMLAPGLSNISRSLSTVAGAIGPSVGLMFAQLGKFVQANKQPLTDFFASALPFMQAFLNLAEQAGKTILPALTQVLQQMVKSGALQAMTQGFVFLLQGVAAFLKEIGPGFKAGAEIFRAAALGVRDILAGLGLTLGWLGKVTQEWLARVHDDWDHFRHDTASVFGAVRHDIAAIWDLIFNNTIGRMERGRHDIAVEWDKWRHDTAVIFDTVRHDIAAAWDAIWNNTIGRVKAGIGTVVGLFERLPGEAVHALWGLGHSLAAFMRAAWDEMWAAMRNIGGTILGWVTHWASDLWHGLLHFFHIGSPSGLFYDIGKNLMLGLRNGIQDHIQHAAGAAMAAARSVASAGSGVQRWAGLVRRALAMEGLSPALAGNVLYQMQTESGGNPMAINLTDINARQGDPSRGLMQVIGTTFQAYHWPGTSWNIYDPLANIAAALNYARHVYGPTLMSGGVGIGSGHGYASGSWNVPYTGPAVVHAGEMIIPAAQAAQVRAGQGGTTVNVTVNAPVGSNPAEIGRQVATVLAEFKKRGGWVYKPAGF